jgi:hypothetical protein
MRHWPLFVLGVLAIAAVCYALLLRRENNQLHEAQTKIDSFCRATKWAVQEDLRDFESGDPKRQVAARDRFYSGSRMHHDATSFLMCLETIPDYEVGCFLGENWKCRATLAKEIEDALQKRYPR